MLPTTIKEYIIAEYNSRKYSRDWRGRFATNSGSAPTTQTFTNQIDGQTFKEAVDFLNSPEHKKFKAKSQSINKKVGLKTKGSKSVVGDTAEWGTEQSIMETFNAGPKTAAYVAALKGRAGNQLAVLNFQENPKGKDTLVTINMPANMTKSMLRDTLTKRKIDFRTIDPRTNQVTVLDIGSANAESLVKLAEDYNATGTFKTGKGDFIGASGDNATRERANRVYDKIIADYEKSPVLISEQSTIHGHDSNWTDSTDTELPYLKVYTKIIAEFDATKVKRDAQGRFSTVESRGAKKPRSRDTKPTFMGNDPKAPSKIAKAYKLTHKPTKAQQKKIMEDALDNNPEYIKRFNNDMALIGEQIAAGKETHKLYGVKFDKKGNVKKFDKTRAKMHNKILRDEYKKINAIKTTVPPVLTVIMGRPGSGKSSFEKKGANPLPWAVWDSKTSYGADPDFFKVKIGQNDKKYSNPITAGLTHEESSFIYKRAVKYALNKKKNLVMDQTLASDKTKAIQAFKDQGYQINLVGVSTSVGSSISSATERYIIPIRDNGSQIPGRLVPPAVSAKNTTNEANFEKIIPIADSWKYYTSKLGTDEFAFVEVAGSPTV